MVVHLISKISEGLQLLGKTVSASSSVDESLCLWSDHLEQESLEKEENDQLSSKVVVDMVSVVLQPGQLLSTAQLFVYLPL